MQVLLLKIQVASLKPTDIFDYAYDDREEVGAEADLNNLVIQALTDPSWIEAMQEELLQFKLQKLETKANGLHKLNPEEGIKNEEGLFAPVARIEAIRLFLAYASFMGLIVYQMDVKSAFVIKEDGIFISQDKYVADILKKFDFTTTKAASTPIETNKALNKDEEAEDVDVHLYRSMIRSLMYLTASRPDIMFAVCAYARFQVTPKTSHLHAVKMIFRYLKGQPKLDLWYPRDSPFDLEAFSDSDYTGASLDRKSTTGGCQFLGKRLISWQCKKQTIVANSTTKAEYVAAANCCGQAKNIEYLKVETLESDLKQTKLTYGAVILTLIMKVRSWMHKIDEDEGITLVQMSEQTQGRHKHDFEESNFEFIAPEEDYTAKPDISTANVPVSTAGEEVSTTSPEVKTTAESLVYIRRSAAKRKDKGKAIMKETEPVQKKTKLQLEQERLGLEEALRLQEQLDEEERQRIARVHEEASTFNVEE
ncbi:uncharacterized mitochondrial protein-like protein [Tanacetum coccineum]|uniref:Uncharacterized mitochondrial protein-like protein n=1 Tax=Tanacetum coccineum TaxID=301880 RepID=A0ABQ4Z6R2_9ASTR